MRDLYWMQVVGQSTCYHCEVSMNKLGIDGTQLCNRNVFMVAGEPQAERKMQRRARSECVSCTAPKIFVCITLKRHQICLTTNHNK